MASACVRKCGLKAEFTGQLEFFLDEKAFCIFESAILVRFGGSVAIEIYLTPTPLTLYIIIKS